MRWVHSLLMLQLSRDIQSRGLALVSQLLLREMICKFMPINSDSRLALKGFFWGRAVLLQNVHQKKNTRYLYMNVCMYVHRVPTSFLAWTVQVINFGWAVKDFGTPCMCMTGFYVSFWIFYVLSTYVCMLLLCEF